MTNFDRFYREAMGLRGLCKYKPVTRLLFDERPPCAPFSSRQAVNALAGVLFYI